MNKVVPFENDERKTEMAIIEVYMYIQNNQTKF